VDIFENKEKGLLIIVQISNPFKNIGTIALLSCLGIRALQ